MPAMSVDVVDSTVTRPPLPFSVAFAAIVAPAATVTFAAVCVEVTPGPPAARSSVVPIATMPPPAWPEASIRAPEATVTLPVALTSMSPPVVPGALPVASSWPSTVIPPPTPFSVTVPTWPPTLFAWILPPACTRFCTMPSAARAVSCTVPPSATITPLLVTSAIAPFGACVTWPVTSSDSMPSPYRSSVALVAPPASTTVAQLRRDHAGIGHLRRHQRRQARLLDRDLALVHHRRVRVRRLVQRQLAAVDEAGRRVAAGRRRDHQPGGVDLRALVEDHPRLVLRMIWPLASILPAICDGLGVTTWFSVTALDDG